MNAAGIPYSQIRNAVAWALAKPDEEVGGFFFRCPELGVMFMNAPGQVDTAEHISGVAPIAEVGPVGKRVFSSTFTIEPSWMAYQILHNNREPLACFHSHPSGIAEPSVTDVRQFPVHYARVGFIYAVGHVARAGMSALGLERWMARTAFQITSYNEMGKLGVIQVSPLESGEMSLNG